MVLVTRVLPGDNSRSPTFYDQNLENRVFMLLLTSIYLFTGEEVGCICCESCH